MERQIRSIAAVAIPALLATLPVTLPTTHASAADDCLAAPNSEAPEGSHWHYRTGRGHRCWFLRPDGRSDGAGHDAGARDALNRRDCDTELSVLKYRKILSGVFGANSMSRDIDAQTNELAEKGCQTQSAAHPED